MAKKKTKKVKLNDGFWHEAADRCSTVNEIIEMMLLYHPAIEQNKGLFKKIVRAQELIGDVYQKCGQKMNDK